MWLTQSKFPQATEPGAAAAHGLLCLRGPRGGIVLATDAKPENDRMTGVDLGKQFAVVREAGRHIGEVLAACDDVPEAPVVLHERCLELGYRCSLVLGPRVATDRVGRRQLAAVLQAIYHGLGAVLMGIILWAAWPSLVESIRIREYVGALGDFTFTATTPDYFRVMGIPLLRGRTFEGLGRREAAPLLLLSAFALRSAQTFRNSESSIIAAYR